MSTPRVWFITGCSTGIGRALTEVALAKGDAVVATARKPATLDALAAAHPPSRLLVLALDVTAEDAVTAAFAAAKARFGRVDVVVNNAGWANVGEVEGLPEAQCRALFETNFWGTVRVTKAALAFFRDENPAGAGGRLLQMSSYLGLVGFAGSSFYSASKHAIEGFTESLAGELDPAWNIKVTLIKPGWVMTEVRNNAVTMMAPQHPAYTNPALTVNIIRALEGNLPLEWKDATRCAEVFYRVGSMDVPPLHLVVGRDAIAAARKQLADLSASIDQFETWSEGLEIALAPAAPAA
ncbi:NAD-P-binding protein [Epithele typhae]|uniref:NAD-P-binding protein n=1 Tax=Epithele typhae TaxID=378194 RepID=UPI0020072F71|nr:NAD-P-binding protein [Epithele typhae]KAH9932820.1 NAD-P-binding protein [Epithele typhae]